MPKFSVTLKKIADQLHLETAYTPTDISNIPIYTMDVNRPGLLLAGYDEYFDPTRLQICGKAEMAYLEGLPEDLRRSHVHTLFALKPPAVIVTRSLPVLEDMLEFAQEYQVPILCTNENTSAMMSNLISILSVELAPRVTRHGVLVEVYGEGILILGDSGVGKSETAVELVKRGHRLVADDAVEIRHIGTRLVGSAPELIRHYIELRGIGVVDIQQLFGMSAVREDQDINLVVNLEQWNDQVFYDRLGTHEEFTTILDMKIPAITIPIKPGRNLAIIVEVAAMNNRHKRMGYNAAQEFAKQLDAHFEQMMLSSQLDAADDYEEYESLSGEEEDTL